MSTTLVLDLETTGFSREWDYILEVAGVLVDNETGEVLDKFHEYIKPPKRIPAKISELTGITDQKVKHCRTEREVVCDFAEWVYIARPDIIMGHNCKAFDLSFLRTKAERYGTIWYDKCAIVDTLQMARDLAKKGKILTINQRQETLAEYFGIKYNAHSAIDDVMALIEIHKRLVEVGRPKVEDLGF